MKRTPAYTLSEIMIIAAILAAIAIPNILKAREGSYRNQCVRQLEEIREAKNLIQQVQNGTNTVTRERVFAFLQKEPKCPGQPRVPYLIGEPGTDPTCTYRSPRGTNYTHALPPLK